MWTASSLPSWGQHRWSFSTAKLPLSFPKTASTTMQSKRSERVGDLILEFVSQVLSREINDPRVGVVTLTGVEVSNDLKHARVFFSVLVNQQGKDEVLSGLRSASGFIRSKIARELKLRYVPTLEFIYDDTQANAQRIEELLRKVKDVE